MHNIYSLFALNFSHWCEFARIDADSHKNAFSNTRTHYIRSRRSPSSLCSLVTPAACRTNSMVRRVVVAAVAPDGGLQQLLVRVLAAPEEGVLVVRGGNSERRRKAKTRRAGLAQPESPDRRRLVVVVVGLERFDPWQGDRAARHLPLLLCRRLVVVGLCDYSVLQNRRRSRRSDRQGSS